MSDLRDLYEEVILDHNRNPRNYPKKPADTSHTAHGYNPLCGDEIQVHLRVADGLIEDVGFEGAGCAISTASASLMTEALKGLSLEQAESLFDQVHNFLTVDDSLVADRQLGKLAVLAGVKEYPMRVKCATLAWHTLQAALNDVTTVSTE